MKLLFVVHRLSRFTVETPSREPLGGTESCMAYLAAQLAANGHDVTLMASLPPGTPQRIRSVRHLPLEAGSDTFFAQEDFEAIIAVGSLDLAPNLRSLAPRAFHAAWLHGLPDQPEIKPLAAMAPHIDCAVFVSTTQHRLIGYTGAAQVIGNGIAPAFENMFASAAELGAAKENRAAYTSTPFRGLDVLRQAFHDARIATTLDVYSSMRIYQEEDDKFTPLYDLLKATPRCQYHGAVGQAELARRLRSAAFLAYPCTFPETYCIAALEAIAAGMKLVSTELGALPETTLGFADLVTLPPGLDRAGLAALFVPALEKMEKDFRTRPQEWAQERFLQSREVNRLCSWQARAKEWENFLAPAIAWKRGAA